MIRALTVKNLYSKKHETYSFEGNMKKVFGKPSTNGIWLVYGKDKNGKTWGSLLIANYLSKFNSVLYISAEEGTDMEFKNAVSRAKIDKNNKNLHFVEYETINELSIRLKKRRSAKIVILDNLTIYNEELRSNGLKKLKQEFPSVLFICVAHEDRNKPYTSSAIMASKLAKVIIRVQGLKLIIGGRVPGGHLMINEKKAQLFYGSKLN